jgi:prepilin-type processing-associated H-X9-DG protein
MSHGTGGPYTGYWIADWELVIRPYFPRSSYSYIWNNTRTTWKTNLFLCPSYKTPPVLTANAVRTTQAWIENSIVGNYRISSVFGYGNASNHSVANRPIYSAKREIKRVSPSYAVLVGEQFRDPPDLGYIGSTSKNYYSHAQTSNILFGDGHAKGTKNMSQDITDKKYQFFVH